MVDRQSSSVPRIQFPHYLEELLQVRFIPLSAKFHNDLQSGILDLRHEACSKLDQI